MTIKQRRSAGGRAPSAPEFDPVPLRARKDGWTPERQRGFIRGLVLYRNVGRAARAVGMSRESAYRLRERPGAEAFAAAWDQVPAVRPPRGATKLDLLWHRACYGVTRPIVRNGKQIGTINKPDNQALLKLYDRFERMESCIQRRHARLARDGRSQ
ncbi:MAG TPA: hypothetical protein VMS43_16075 [Allosphingosinicella sp.]|nr:hypothetical protein [Allosphingosinicella sp.]